MNIYKLSRSLSFSLSCDVTFSTRCVFCRRFNRFCKHYAKNKVEGKVIQIHQKISKLDGVRLFRISLPQSENVILCVHAQCKPAVAANLSLGFDNLAAKLFHSFDILVHRINSYVDCDLFMTTWYFSFHHTSADCLLAFVIGACGKHPVFHRTRHLFHLPSKQATTLTWVVGKDIEGVVQELKAKGVTFEHYDMPDVTREDDIHVAGNMKVAWFKDPDGNILNIING